MKSKKLRNKIGNLIGMSLLKQCDPNYSMESRKNDLKEICLYYNDVCKLQDELINILETKLGEK